MTYKVIKLSLTAFLIWFWWMICSESMNLSIFELLELSGIASRHHPITGERIPHSAPFLRTIAYFILIAGWAILIAICNYILNLWPTSPPPTQKTDA